MAPTTGAPSRSRSGKGGHPPAEQTRSASVDPELAAQLLTSMVGARWFAGKGRRAELTGLTPLPWLTDRAGVQDAAAASWPALRFEVAEISYAEEQAAAAGADTAPYELYQLAVSYYSDPQPSLQHAELARLTDPDLGPVVAYDATQDPAACTLILRALLVRQQVETENGAVLFHLTEASRLTEDLTPQVFRGQQSNTSVMLGEVGMIKLFRRIELGHNLDIEVHDALGQAGVADLAALYGWIDATWPHRGALVHADLAMVVEKLESAEDGWELALDSLRAGTSFADEAAKLGAALADIHAGLRTAFPTDRHSGAGTAAVMKERLQAARTIAPALEVYLDGLNARFDELAETQLETQRVHGDFHLGQTLRTPEGWKIIDFEGEPVKTLAERATPDSVWRDIAGMLRSFDYAGASVPGPESASWVQSCREAFLQAYAGGGLDPKARAVLQAYEADKAIYEVVYEVRNRPDWVGIPLGAIATLAGSAGPEPDDVRPAHPQPTASSDAGVKE